MMTLFIACHNMEITYSACACAMRIAREEEQQIVHFLPGYQRREKQYVLESPTVIAIFNLDEFNKKLLSINNIKLRSVK
jgi:hypothetical protein